MRVSLPTTCVLSAACFSFGTAFGLILGVPVYRDLVPAKADTVIVTSAPIKGRIIAPAVLDRLTTRLHECESSLWNKVNSKVVIQHVTVPAFKTTIKPAN